MDDDDVVLNLDPGSFDDLLPRRSAGGSKRTTLAPASHWAASVLPGRKQRRERVQRVRRAPLPADDMDDAGVSRSHAQEGSDDDDAPASFQVVSADTCMSSRVVGQDNADDVNGDGDDDDDDGVDDLADIKKLRRKGTRVAAVLRKHKEAKQQRAAEAHAASVSRNRDAAHALTTSRTRAQAVRAASVTAPSSRAAQFAKRITSFADEHLALAQPLVDALAAQQLTRPTAIQVAALPPLLAGRDALLRAQTGSGKTLAYMVPIVQALVSVPERIPRSQGTRAVIVAPTRELCTQIDQVVRAVLKPFHWIVSTTLTGGENRKSEKARLRRGVHIVIATPGRLLDHLQHTAAFNRSALAFLVLDEADRLLDMGFEPTLRAIVDALGAAPRVSVLCSATLDASVTKLATLSLSDPVVCDTSSGPSPAKHLRDDSAAVNVNNAPPAAPATAPPAAAEASASDESMPLLLRQFWLDVPYKLRLAALLGLLRREAQRAPSSFKAIVFVSPCASVSFLHAVLQKRVRLDATQQQLSVAYAAVHDRQVDRAAAAHEDAALEEMRGFDVAPGAEHLLPAGWQRDSDPGAAHTEDGNNDDAAGLDGSLLLDDVPVWPLHGQMPQIERTRVFLDYCAAATGVLICTDVAARGLDLPNVDWIIQYDAPTNLADYVHRVGRTARMGRRGQAVLFLSPGAELGLLDLLRQRRLQLSQLPLRQALSSLSLLSQHSQQPGRGQGRRGGGPDLDAAHRLCFQLERVVAADRPLAALARDAFTAHVRAYATHSRETKACFHVRNLHLGHVAKSFALVEPPSLAGKQAQQQDRRGSGKRNTRKRPGASRADSSVTALSAGPASKKRRVVDTRMPG